MADRIGLLARGAADNAGAHLRVAVLAFKKFWHDLAGKRLEGFGVAEKLGHADQQIVEQLVGFFRPLFQNLDIFA